MPRIPYQSAQNTFQIPRPYGGGKVSPNETGMPQMGGGLEVLAAVSEQFRKAELNRQTSNAETSLVHKLGEIDDKWTNQVVSWNPDLEKERDNDLDGLRKFIDDGDYDEEVKRSLAPGLEKALSSASVVLNSKIRSLHVDKMREDSDTNLNSLSQLVSRAKTPQEKEAAIGLAQLQLDRDVISGSRKAEERGDRWRKFNEDVEQFRAVNLIQQNPDKAIEYLSDQNNFQYLDPLKRLELHDNALNESYTSIVRGEALSNKARAERTNNTMTKFIEASRKGELIPEFSLTDKNGNPLYTASEVASLEKARLAHNEQIALGGGGGGESNLTAQGAEGLQEIRGHLEQGNLFEAQKSYLQYRSVLPEGIARSTGELINKGFSAIEKREFKTIDELRQTALASSVPVLDWEFMISAAQQQVARGEEKPEELSRIVAAEVSLYFKKGATIGLWKESDLQSGLENKLTAEQKLKGVIGRGGIPRTTFVFATNKGEKELAKTTATIMDDVDKGVIPAEVVNDAFKKFPGDPKGWTKYISDWKESNKAATAEPEGEEEDFLTVGELIETGMGVPSDIAKNLINKYLEDPLAVPKWYGEKVNKNLKKLLIEYPNLLIPINTFKPEQAIKDIEEFWNKPTTVRKKKD